MVEIPAHVLYFENAFLNTSTSFPDGAVGRGEGEGGYLNPLNLKRS